MTLHTRVKKLEQQRPLSMRRIVVFYEDSRQAWETDEEAMTRQGIAPQPKDVLVRVRYASPQEARPDESSTHEGPNPTSLLPGAISLAETVLRPFQ
jgi:hypothetical protein